MLTIAACGPASGPPSRQEPAARDSLLAIGESLYVHEKYDSARVVWRISLDRARAAGDQRSQGRALAGIGLASYRLGDLRVARQNEEAALALKNDLAGTADLRRAYGTLGLIAVREGRLEEGITLFDQMIALAKLADDSASLARGYGNRALALMNLGDLAAAREAHRAQRAMAHAIGNVQLEANGLTNEAAVDIWEGDARPAIARLDTARSLYRRINYTTGEEAALSQLATAFELTGEIDKAFATLDTALSIARRLQLETEEAEKLRLLAELHLRVGDHRRAAASYDDAVERMRKTGYTVQLPSALRGSAEAHLRLGNLRRARSNAEEALGLDSTAHDPLEQLDDELLLAEIVFRSSGLGAAEPHLRAGLALADQLKTRGSRIAVAIAEAHLADLAHNPQRVLRALRGAAPDLAAGDFGAEWQTNALAARAFARLNQLDSAAAVGRRAVEAVERLRGELASEALRTTYVADRADVYSDLAIVLLRLKRSDEAFAVADGARSGVLLRNLSSAREGARTGPLPVELLEGEDLLRRIDGLVQKLRESERGRRRERGAVLDSTDALLAAQLATARGQYEALVIRGAQSRPRTAAMFGTTPVRIEDVSRVLERDEALLEYLLTPERIFVFVITRNGMRVLSAPIATDEITQQIRLLRDLWGSPRPEWKWGLDASRALHRTLVAPVQDAGALKGVRKVVVVPHGILGQVPFAALTDARTGRYLIQDYAVTELPSAATFPALRNQPRAPGPFSTDALGLAPFPDELPATKREVDAFRASMGNAQVREGRRATEREMRRALAGAGVVHVATHGVLNVRNPMFSRIELARPAVVASDDDGRLEMHELLGLGINSQLVFLSGCETGAGQEWTDDPVRGATELTLAQAFLSAGASNVILTLWRVDDAGAAAFAQHFYRGLARQSVSQALADAQRAMAADNRYASPYYWAGYLLSGEGQVGGKPQDSAIPSVPITSDTRRRTP